MAHVCATRQSSTYPPLLPMFLGSFIGCSIEAMGGMLGHYCAPEAKKAFFYALGAIAPVIAYVTLSKNPQWGISVTL